jgi:hypothetical protein
LQEDEEIIEVPKLSRLLSKEKPEEEKGNQ